MQLTKDQLVVHLPPNVPLWKENSAKFVKKLRALILELAVRGLLVPQDSDDEPARVLLEKISAEKERLINDGMLKQPKKLPAITEEENIANLPKGITPI